MKKTPSKKRFEKKVDFGKFPRVSAEPTLDPRRLPKSTRQMQTTYRKTTYRKTA